MKKYTEYKQLNLSALSKEILKNWEDENVFQQISGATANLSFFTKDRLQPMGYLAFTM
jgi:hypothetical protein